MKYLKPSKQLWAYIAVFIWPVIYCFRFFISGESFSLTISNDFYYLYHCKVYLLDKLSSLSFPLWSPSEACGYPFYSNPFTQSFYLPNIFLTVFYKLAGGYSYADHQKFTVLGISVFSTGLLLWLRSLNVKILYAVIAVCLVSVSSKMTEILRFPNAVHTVAWIPFILYGCTALVYMKKKYIPMLVIFISSVLMITAGYPYNAYHSMFLIVPYIILLIILIRKKICFEEIELKPFKYAAQLTASFLAAAVVCYPLIKGIKELMDNVAFRRGDDFAFSTFFKFTFRDTVGSLVYPPAATIEGWYYFGIVGILITGSIFIFLLINKSRYKNGLAIFLFILAWYIFISYITYGEDSYLFGLLWKYFPGFSRLRIWGRMNIIFLPAFCFMLAYSLKLFSGFIKNKFTETESEKSFYKSFIAGISAVYVLILASQIYLMKFNTAANHTISYFKNLYKELNESSFLIFGAVSFLILLLTVLSGKRLSSKIALSVFLTIFFLINAADLYNAGALQWAARLNPDSKRTVLNIDKTNMDSFETPRNEKLSLISLTSQFNAGFVDEWSYESYKNFTEDFQSKITEENMERELTAYNDLLGITNGKKIFLSEEINYASVSEFITNSGKFDSLSLINPEIERYNGDELVCRLKADRDGYFSFIDNWDKNWKAEVNGTETVIEKLFGTFKSVRFKKGENRIIFRYSPEFF